MAQKTLDADRSSILAYTGSTNLGGGQDLHLTIVASATGYDLRGVVGFTIPASFYTGMSAITKVELRLTSTGGAGSGNHVGIGSAPKAYIRRVTAQWTANSAGESWSTSPTVYPGPAASTTAQVLAALGSGSAVYIDITALAKTWAPSTLGGAGAVCYGVLLVETGGATDAGEVHSAKASASLRPQLRYTYDTNARPAAPTLSYPVGPDQPATKFKATTTDPEQDPIVSYDLQVSTDSTFAVVSHWNAVNATAGLAGYVVDANYAGTPLTTGTRYYWRARMADAGGDGAWSSVGTFVKIPTGGPAADAYDYWSAAIIEDMREGRTILELGTLRPIGAEVEQLVCAEFGDLFRVVWDETTPPVDEDVYLLGQRVALTPDGWSVDAIVERKRDVG